jgi:hypothetical protein
MLLRAAGALFRNGEASARGFAPLAARCFAAETVNGVPVEVRGCEAAVIGGARSDGEGSGGQVRWGGGSAHRCVPPAPPPASLTQGPQRMGGAEPHSQWDKMGQKALPDGGQPPAEGSSPARA